MISILRILIMLLLALVLWNPNIPFGKAPVDVFLILDDSLSMAGKLDSSTWARLCKRLQNLPKHSRIALLRFGKQPQMELPLTDIEQPEIRTLLTMKQPLKVMAIERDGSNLEAALLLAAQQIRPERPTKLLLINDKQQTAGNAETISRTLQQQGHTLFQLDLSQTNTAEDVWVQHLNAPSYAESGQKIPISVTLGSNSLKQATLSISINGVVQQQTSVQLVAGSQVTLPFTLTNCSSAICLISAELTTDSSDAIAANNQFQHVINTQAAKPILYVHRTPSQTPLLNSLISANYPVKTLDASACTSAASTLSRYRSIILDDLAVADVAPSCWQAIEKTVRNHGLGLIVLGGMHSFSAGAYRHSVLEGLLPVTAEAGKQTQACTLLFLIDKSGSMDINNEGVDRLAMAKQALLKTLESQGQQDNFGLISFDSQAKLAIPIQHYDDPVAIIQQYFTSPATGGTLLKPALDLGIEQLANLTDGKRFLVLVTDGFLDDQDLQLAEQRLATEKIQVIVLAIGSDTRTNHLQRLAAVSHGILLHIDNIAELPMLMRKALDERRLPIANGRIQVNQTESLPFIPAKIKWPDISGYNITRLKPNSTVYLRTDQGDPILAAGYEGMGRVVVLASGLGNWTAEWFKWQPWGKFVGGLIDWSAQPTKHPQLEWTLLSPDTIQVDAISASQNWITLSSGSVTINNQDNQLSSQSLTLAAPGRYQAKLPLISMGLQHVNTRIGDSESSFYLFSNATAEYLPSSQASNVETTPFSLHTPQPFTAMQSLQIRKLLLPVVLLLYLLQVYLTLFQASKNFSDSR